MSMWPMASRVTPVPNSAGKRAVCCAHMSCHGYTCSMRCIRSPCLLSGFATCQFLAFPGRASRLGGDGRRRRRHRRVATGRNCLFRPKYMDMGRAVEQARGAARWADVDYPVTSKQPKRRWRCGGRPITQNTSSHTTPRPTATTTTLHPVRDISFAQREPQPWRLARSALTVRQQQPCLGWATVSGA